MSMETVVFNALQALVSGRVFPDLAPEDTIKPYITFQQVGGEAINFIEGAIPSKRNSRVQLNVWALSRKEAAELARQVEDTLRTTSALQTTVLGSHSSDYEPETQLYGTRQDFSFWN